MCLLVAAVVKKKTLSPPGSAATGDDDEDDRRARVALRCEASGLLFVLMREEFSVSHPGEKAGVSDSRKVWTGHVSD